MIKMLFDNEQLMHSYIIRAIFISLIPTVLLAAMLIKVMPDKGLPIQGALSYALLIFLVIGAWIETMLMWPILGILKLFIDKQLTIAFLSSIIWGILHSLSMPTRGLIIWWPFFVYSLCFLSWETKSLGKAILLTSFVHMFHNVLSFVLIVLLR